MEEWRIEEAVTTTYGGHVEKTYTVQLAHDMVGYAIRWDDVYTYKELVMAREHIIRETNKFKNEIKTTIKNIVK